MRERDGLYPKEALSGTFVWYSTARSLSLELYYREADLTGPLAPLIFSSVSDVVRIQVTLLADIAEFQLSDQHGEISFWSLHRYRKLGDANSQRVRGLAMKIHPTVQLLLIKNLIVIGALCYFGSAQALLWWIAISVLLYSLFALNGVLNLETQPREKGD
jgi:hypothetical protein